MIRNILLPAIVFAGLAGAAFAQEGPRLVGGAGNGGAEVEYGTAPMGDFVGRAESRIIAGGAERSYVYGRTQGVEGRIGRIVGGGDNQHVEYDAVVRPGGIASAQVGAPRG
jgi:hypothetical protein